MEKVDVRPRKGRDIDEMLSPDDKVIYRCVDCQTFLFPRELHVVRARFRSKKTGEAVTIPFEICPVCFPQMPTYKTPDDVPRCEFVTLTRHQYEQTKTAEKWGMLYDPKTDTIRSRLIIAH